MRPVTFRLAVLSAALLSPLASVEAASRGGGGGHAGGASRSGHVRAHIGARVPRGFGTEARRGGWRHGGEYGRGAAYRNLSHGVDGRFGTAGVCGFASSGCSVGYGYGGYGFGYGGYGFAPGHGGYASGYGHPGGLPGRPFFGEPSGLPVAHGIPSPPVQPPAIYVVGSGAVGKAAGRVRRSGGPVTAGSDEVGAGSGVIVSGPRVSRLR